MSKTAFLISGHARSFKWLFANQCEKVFATAHDPVFFCSVVEDEQAHDLELLKTKFDPTTVHIEYVADQPNCVELIGRELFPKAAASYLDQWFANAVKRSKYRLAPHATPQTVFASLWHQQRVYEMALNSGIKDLKYFVRHRPDLSFTNLEIPASVAPNDCFTPWWSQWGGINDRFAIMGHIAASAYFTCFKGLPVFLQRGVAIHPETLSGYNLRHHLIDLHPLNCEFSAVRVPDPTTGQAEIVQPNYSVTDLWNLVRDFPR